MLILPRVAYGSDMSGAIPIAFGMLAVVLAVAGLLVIALLRFGFKRKGMILTVPLLPALAVAGFTAFIVAAEKLSPKGKHFHRGPDLGDAQGDCSAHSEVSRSFGEPQLARLYESVSSSQFKSDLSHYTGAPVPNYVFAVDLAVPVVIEPETDRPKPFVYLSISPAPESSEPACAAINYLFARTVAQIDPAANTALPPEPPRIQQPP